MTIGVLAEKGQNHCEIARQLGVTEGTVRYHLGRAAAGAEDGRRDKPERAESVAEVIAAWHADREDEARPVNVADLHDHLVADSHSPLENAVRFPHPPQPGDDGWERGRE